MLLKGCLGCRTSQPKRATARPQWPIGSERCCGWHTKQGHKVVVGDGKDFGIDHRCTSDERRWQGFWD
ncbi:hypothetical protein O6P43_005867 [Quillaja saponaria]|uniref:Uncharacterized protein n=1 Tax=Quillaja saponaria TaxID=32244 RepID=A0AAD7Q7U0_QUISA|nr:hypothetical protein O6P43_005867 [Quillaja saponaria]